MCWRKYYWLSLYSQCGKELYLIDDCIYTIPHHSLDTVDLPFCAKFTFLSRSKITNNTHINPHTYIHTHTHSQTRKQFYFSWSIQFINENPQKTTNNGHHNHTKKTELPLKTHRKGSKTYDKQKKNQPQQRRAVIIIIIIIKRAAYEKLWSPEMDEHTNTHKKTIPTTSYNDKRSLYINKWFLGATSKAVKSTKMHIKWGYKSWLKNGNKH